MTRRSTRGIVTCVLAATAAAIPLRAQTSLEYNVKAALLLNFARFIEWPDAAFATAQAPVQVCVFGHNPFGDGLARTLQGETVHARSLAARQVKSQADSSGCHLLFVPSGTESRAGAVIHQENSFAVTVGESPRFEAIGGAVNFILEEGRVRFNVNLQPVESRGIRISARMLQLANRVGRATPAK
jgi:hypothetical protein